MNFVCTVSKKSDFKQAEKEALKQIREGLIQGTVFGKVGGPLAALGFQCVHPQKVPMTEQSRFDIASVGKIFTAACCALLAVEGKLDPDAPFTEYLPEHILGKDCNITVRDLAMHVGGFDNAKPYNSSDKTVFFHELFQKRPVRSRLTEFEYSCSGFILLGMIVERLSGTNLEDFARSRIWAPLGMNRTRWTSPGNGLHEVEHWFPNREAGQHNDDVCFNCGFPIGSGSCFSTAGDLLLFARDMLERRHFPDLYYELQTRCAFEKKGVRRSFGWDMSEAHRPAHLSDKTFYHSGWTGQSICIDPENEFAAVVLTSRTDDWDAAYAGRVYILEKLVQCHRK